MRRTRKHAQNLRQAIDCMPRRTREAMLDGLDSNEIIVGAYTDRSGRVCPMLAAHRRGGRTSLASFARAWDRYTSASTRPRPATERELRTLRCMLEASLYMDDKNSEIARAAAEHRALKEHRDVEDVRERPDTGERDRTQELSRRPGWAWLRVFRRYDEYEAALADLEEARRAAERERELV